MSPIHRLFREPALILGVLIAFFGMATLLEWIEMTQEQIGGVITFAGAVVALLRFILTPSSEVVAQQPNDNQPVKAGAKAENAWGIPKGHAVEVNAVTPLPSPGATDATTT